MSAMNPYRTLRQFASDEFIINKSRFIGYAAPCETEAEALAFLQSIRTKHKDATHNCYGLHHRTERGHHALFRRRRTGRARQGCR